MKKNLKAERFEAYKLFTNTREHWKMKELAEHLVKLNLIPNKPGNIRQYLYPMNQELRNKQYEFYIEETDVSEFMKSSKNFISDEEIFNIILKKYNDVSLYPIYNRELKKWQKATTYQEAYKYDKREAENKKKQVKNKLSKMNKLYK